ncbi:restriction endonuclease subunit S [Coleofasciculus chthonoplastes]|uniref:restriction endonuclease subunit S n=1 Tax=Coleofasciculus chthonoplastes TaxID=64178 RepID=UPI0032FCCBE9
MSDWKEITLGDLVTFQRGHDLSQKQFLGGKYPIVSSYGIIGYHNKSTTSGHGVTIGRSGNSIGKPFFVESEFWAHNTTLYVKEFHDSFPRFVYYLLQTINFRALDSGSAVPSLNRNYIHPLPIKVPEYDEQKKIADVLNCLDRKIENLRKQNDTLEAIAQTLFKHWFVDFEFPNADGKPYKSSGGAMEPSELGEIPAGWRVVRIEEIADRIAMEPFGSRIKTDNFVDSGVPVIRGGNLVNGFNESDFVYITEEKADDLKSSNAFPEDIIFTHRGTLGQVGFIPTNSQYPRYVVSQNQMLLSVNKKLVSSRYVYRFFCSKGGLNAILANTNTTGVPSIGRPTTTLKSIQLVIPEKSILSQFDSLIRVADLKKEANSQQMKTLAETRDFLLPKLMNGKICIA